VIRSVSSSASSKACDMKNDGYILGLQPSHQGEKVQLFFRCQSRCRLVKNNDTCLMMYCTCDLDHLLLCGSQRRDGRISRTRENAKAEAGRVSGRDGGIVQPGNVWPTLISACRCLNIGPSINDTLASGTCRNATASALMTKSLIDSR
jgi:hypothetical protein